MAAQFLLLNGCEEIVSNIQAAVGQNLSPSDQLQELLLQLVREVPGLRIVMTSRVEALGYKSECNKSGLIPVTNILLPRR